MRDHSNFETYLRNRIYFGICIFFHQVFSPRWCLEIDFWPKPPKKCSWMKWLQKRLIMGVCLICVRHLAMLPHLNPLPFCVIHPPTPLLCCGGGEDHFYPSGFHLFFFWICTNNTLVSTLLSAPPMGRRPSQALAPLVSHCKMKCKISFFSSGSKANNKVCHRNGSSVMHGRMGSLHPCQKTRALPILDPCKGTLFSKNTAAIFATFFRLWFCRSNDRPFGFLLL